MNKNSGLVLRTLSKLMLVILLMTLMSGPIVSRAAPAAVGDIILVDFLESHTAPVGNWNTITWANMNSTVSNLIDSTGAATGVSYTGSGWGVPLGSNETTWTAGNKAWVLDDAADDGFSSPNGGTSTITLGGLAGSSYSVELVVASILAGDVADYTIGGSFADHSFNCTFGVNGDNFDAQTDGRDPGNWLIWDNVAPSGGNIVITIDASGAGGTFGDANALRLEEVNANTPVTMDVNKTPECTGGLVMANNTFLQDAGDESNFVYNGVANNVTVDLPAGVVQRWSRVWDCTVTDINSNGGTVDVTFDFVLAGMNNSSPPAGTASNYKLLHRSGTSGDFSVIASGTSVDTGNWTVTFTGVDSTVLGSEITLGTTDATNSPTAVTLQSFGVQNQAPSALLGAAFLFVLAGAALPVVRRKVSKRQTARR